jgi:hypothetical protein
MIFKQCILLGIGEYGDTNGLANSYIDGFTGAMEGFINAPSLDADSPPLSVDGIGTQEYPAASCTATATPAQ